MAAVPVYPDVLREGNWLKHKGIVAKIVTTPSKISEKLKELATEYAAVPWAKIFTVPGDLTAEATTQAQFQAIKEFNSEVKPFVEAITDVKVHAVGVKAVWDKNKLVPAASKTHLDNIIKGCDSFKAAIGLGWTTTLAEYETAKKRALLKHPNAGAPAAAPAVKSVGPGKTAGQPKGLKIKPGAMPARAAKKTESEGSESESSE